MTAVDVDVVEGSLDGAGCGGGAEGVGGDGVNVSVDGCDVEVGEGGTTYSTTTTTTLKGEIKKSIESLERVEGAHHVK